MTVMCKLLWMQLRAKQSPMNDRICELQDLQCRNSAKQKSGGANIESSGVGATGAKNVEQEAVNEQQEQGPIDIAPGMRAKLDLGPGSGGAQLRYHKKGGEKALYKSGCPTQIVGPKQ